MANFIWLLPMLNGTSITREQLRAETWLPFWDWPVILSGSYKRPDTPTQNPSQSSRGYDEVPF